MNHAQFWGGGGVTSYEIEQSLRFDGSSYLSRTPSSSGNRRSWSLSVWLKFDRGGNRAANNTTEFPFMWAGNYNRLQFAGSKDGTTPAGTLGPNLLYDYVTNRGYTSAGYRDPSAWYHVVFAYDANNGTNNDRARYYVNGERQLWGNTTGGWGNQDSLINSNTTHWLGTNNSQSSLFYTGYMAEYHFLDGTSVTNADDFGELNDEGVWVPKEVAGVTYGTNGFYLKFDPSATNGIGHDHSGNGNNFTASNFTTSGTGTDVMSDTPTTNWCTWNPLDVYFSSGTFSNGNLDLTTNGGNPYGPFTGSIGMASGKWYWEITPTAVSSGSFTSNIGILQTKTLNDYLYSQPTGYAYRSDGQKGNNSTISSYGASYAINDVIGVAYNADSGSLEFYKNGTSQGVAYTGLSGTYFPAVSDESSTQSTSFTANFGQRAFEYTPPTGYKALNTANLPAPDIADGSKNFNTVLYTGNSSNNHAITGVGFQPDFVWIKDRNVTGHDNVLTDVVRGNTKVLRTNVTNAEYTQTDAITSFDSDGFTLGDDNSVGEAGNFNTNNAHVAWNWLAANGTSSIAAGSIDGTNPTIASTVSANPTAGFSIVSYTGNDTAGATVGHGLGVPPDMMIIKHRNSTYNWVVYHSSLDASAPEDYWLALNDPGDRAGPSTNIWQSTAPTSTTFKIGDMGQVNANNQPYIAYCFAEVEGYSKFGSYTGNNNDDNVFIYLGFTPAFVMIKNVDQSSNWIIHDTTRDTYNPSSTDLYPNTSGAEPAYEDNYMDFLSNGIKIRDTSGPSGNSNTYIYAAFAANPFGGSGVSPATAR